MYFMFLTKPFFSYFLPILKFAFLPITPVFMTIYFDLFQFDLFNTKKVLDLTEQVQTLQEITLEQNLEITRLKEQSSNINEIKNQNFDIQQVVVYTSLILSSMLIIGLVYTYFINNNNNGTEILTEHISNNSKQIIENIGDQTRITVGAITDSNSNIINNSTELQKTTVEIVSKIVNESTTSIENSTSGGLNTVAGTITEKDKILTQFLGECFSNINNYIANNVSSKLNLIHEKLDKMSQLISNVSESSSPTTSSNWGEGRLLNSGETVNASIPNVTSLSNFDLKPDDLEFKK